MPSPSNVLLRTQSDARLTALARDGHDRAFEAIVERHRRALLRTCRRVLPEARAEDALQQALLAAWTAIARGDDIRDLRPWLHRIAHNTALNHLRVSGYDFEELRDSLRIADTADDELERRAVMRQTLAGLAALPERQRDALLAIAVDGRSQDEVASDLGLSSGAVRQLVHRARSSLRAAATAITPLPVVTWIAAAATRSEPMAVRIGELTAGAGGAGAATALAKAGAVAVVAGGAVTGPALVERTHTHHAATPRAQSADVAPARSDAAAASSPGAAPRRALLVSAPAAVVKVAPRQSSSGAPSPAPRATTRRAPQRTSGAGRGGSGEGGDDAGAYTAPAQRRSGRGGDDGSSGSSSGSDSSGEAPDTQFSGGAEHGAELGGDTSGGDRERMATSSGPGGGETLDAGGTGGGGTSGGEALDDGS